MPGVPVVIPSRGGRKCIPESRQATTPTMKALPSSILSALLLVAPPIGAFSQEDSYVPGPDSAPQPGVPQGELVKFEFARSKVFPGTTRQVTVYVPRQYDPARPACVYVDQDGLVGRRIHQLHLDLAERAIVLGITGLIGQYVLIPQRLVQHLENLPILALKQIGRAH